MESLNKSVDQSTDFKEKLKLFFGTGIKLDMPFAIWKNPGELLINSALQLGGRDCGTIDELENAVSGFVFAPFEVLDTHKKQFIKSDISCNSESVKLLISPNYRGKNETVEEFNEVFHSISADEKFKFSDYLSSSPDVQSSKAHFTNLVTNCIESISDGYYQKIVPSRRHKHKTKKHFHPVDEFFKLCNTYEKAFVSIVFIPDQGLWMGSTPELLISVDDNKKFKTISLAGTQPVRHDFNPSKVAWTQKEIEEQALVSRYIVNCFKQIRLREFDEYGPKTVKAGNLIHLKTIFEVDIEKVGFPQLGSVMLDLLHPTSAICGMPMKPAAKFIKENEGYNREYYSGYLGPVNHQYSTAIYVNLRCARVYKDALLLFAGAGVTEDSDPELEWEETEIKIQTLLNVIEF